MWLPFLWKNELHKMSRLRIKGIIKLDRPLSNKQFNDHYESILYSGLVISFDSTVLR